MQRLDGFKVGRNDFEQGAGWAGGMGAMLLPVLQGAQAHANQFGKRALADV